MIPGCGWCYVFIAKVLQILGLLMLIAGIGLYVFIAKVLQILGLLMLIAGIGLAVYQLAKELIKFNKNR